MRCYLPPEFWTTQTTILDPEESRHLVQVMRSKPGDRVEIIDGKGRRGKADVVSADRKKTVLRIIESHEDPPTTVRPILIQAIPREQKMDWIIQKATELGVSVIQPVQSGHSLVRLDPERAADKQERWWKIALNAAKQSGASRIPEIRPPVRLTDYLSSKAVFDLLLLCSLAEGARPIFQSLEKFNKNFPMIGILIGPEGDFTSEETAAALQAGAVPVSLGASVLRTETAALYVLSVLRYRFG